MVVAHSQLERSFRVKSGQCLIPGGFVAPRTEARTISSTHSEYRPACIPALGLMSANLSMREGWRLTVGSLERDCSTQQLPRPKPKGLISYCLVQLASWTAARAIWGASFLLGENLIAQAGLTIRLPLPRECLDYGVLDHVWHQLGSFTKY